MAKICKRGHASSALPGGRWAGGACKECEKITATKRYAENPERKRASNAKWEQKNPEHKKARFAKWAHENAERIRANAAKRYDPERQKVRYAKWRAENPEKRRAGHARRRAAKLHQRCTCCEDWQINWFYDISIGEVDHVIPLGLGGHHCAKNLMALTVEEHKKKTCSDRERFALAKRINRLLKGWKLS